MKYDAKNVEIQVGGKAVTMEGELFELHSTSSLGNIDDMLDWYWGSMMTALGRDRCAAILEDELGRFVGRPYNDECLSEMTTALCQALRRILEEIVQQDV